MKDKIDSNAVIVMRDLSLTKINNSRFLILFFFFLSEIDELIVLVVRVIKSNNWEKLSKIGRCNVEVEGEIFRMEVRLN